MTDVTDAEVRELAYQLWERDGSPDGRDEHYWHAAKKLLADEGDAVPDEELLPGISIMPLAGLVSR